MINRLSSNRYKWISVLLIMIMTLNLMLPLRTTVSSGAEGTKAFKVIITYEVTNANDEDTNKILVYYWEPNDNGYELKNSFVSFTKTAKYKGTHTLEAEIPGPIQSVDVYVHGSVTDASQYYMTKVEQQTNDLVAGCNKDERITLWDGKLGCSVATMGSNTIYNKLIFNSSDGKGKFPSFQGWRDPGSEKSAVFGDDKYEKTNSAYNDVCKKPEREGIAGFGIYGFR